MRSLAGLRSGEGGMTAGGAPFRPLAEAETLALLCEAPSFLRGEGELGVGEESARWGVAGRVGETERELYVRRILAGLGLGGVECREESGLDGPTTGSCVS